MNFDNLIERIGTSVTLKTVTLPTLNTTAAETYVDTTINVIFTGLNANRKVQDAIIDTGDMGAYLKSGQAVKERDIFVYNTENWEVIAVNVKIYNDDIVYKKVILKKQTP